MKHKIILAGQNETIRKYPGESSFDLATMSLGACAAVLITSKSGHQSLTHVDSDTDLSFIEKELTWMEAQKGEYTIDIVVNQTVKKSVGEKVKAFIEEQWGEVKNLKGNAELRKSSYANLLVREGEKKTSIYMLPYENFFELMGIQKLTPQNPLKDSMILPAPKDLKERIENRQLAIYFLADSKQLPVVAYDRGWTKAFPALPEKFKLQLDQWQKEYDRLGAHFNSELSHKVFSASHSFQLAASQANTGKMEEVGKLLQSMLITHWQYFKPTQQKTAQQTLF